MSYGEPKLKQSISLPGSAVITASVKHRVQGPPGSTGRLVGMCGVISTTLTGSNSLIRVGSAADPDAYGTLTLVAGAVGVAVATFTRGVLERIPADAVVQIDSDGGSTAGAADLTIDIDWE